MSESTIVPGLPDVKPETAIEVTSPITKIEADMNSRCYNVTFAEGETLSIPVRDVPEAGALTLMLAQAIGDHLAYNELVWADPTIVAAQLAATGGSRF